uniref:CCDC66 domain-containing protein n=1 Tax=Steinernema glaseri TaxID=37863 RepID=A0A1I7YNK6_9BILA
MTEKAKVRSAEEEEALDRRIAEIRRKNEALERRQKEVEEDRARAQPQRKHSAATEHASAVLGDEKKSQHQKKESVKRSNEKGIKEWSREWDHGKTSAETWIVNVPEMDHETKSSFNRTANQRGGRGGHRGGRGGPANIANAGSRRSTGGESSKSHRSQHDDRSTPPKKEERGGLAGRLTRTDANGKKESVTVAQIQDKNHNNPKRPNLNTRGGHEFSARGRGAPRTRGGAQGRPEAAKEPRAKNVSNFPKPNVNHNKNRQHFNKNNNRGGPRNNNSDAKVIRLLVDDLVTKACQLALSEELQS